jgi:hypothetical protein
VSECRSREGSRWGSERCRGSCGRAAKSGGEKFKKKNLKKKKIQKKIEKKKLKKKN